MALKKPLKPGQKGFQGIIGNNFVGQKMLDPRGFYNIPDYLKKGQNLHIYPNSNRRTLSSAAPAPFKPTASTAPTITQPAATPAAAPDPRDATFFNDTAKLDQYYKTTGAGLDLKESDALRDLTKGNVLLDEQLPKDQLSAKENANKSGLFYSGALSKNLGEIETDYTRKRANLQDTYASGKAGREIERSDLVANYGPNGLLRNDAVINANTRQSDRDLTQGVPAPTPAAPAAAKLPPGFRTVENYKSPTGQVGTMHIYPDGRKVFVKKK